MAMVLGLSPTRVNDMWGQPMKGNWAADPKGGNQDFIQFTVTVVGWAPHQVAEFKDLIQKDLKDPKGIINTPTNNTFYRDEEEHGKQQVHYKNRVYDPEAVPSQYAALEGTHLGDDSTRSLRRKFLYVASNEMNCVIRYRFLDPSDLNSKVELAPRTLDGYWFNKVYKSPFLCNAGKCYNRTTDAPILRPRRPGEKALTPSDMKERVDPGPDGSEQIPKKCLKEDRTMDDCRCTNLNDDCLTRDEEICFSPIGGPLTKANKIYWVPEDPEVIHVTSEEDARVVQLNATTGEVIQVSPSYGQMGSGYAMYAKQHDYGICRDNNPADGIKYCTGPDSELENSNMPWDGPDRVKWPCFTDADCRPDLINTTYLAVENADSCEHQAILKQTNQTARERETTMSFDANGKKVYNVLASESEGRMKASFAGWLKDKGIKYPHSVQLHKELGLLVSTGGLIQRYDPISGKHLQTLVDLGKETGEEKELGDITCFHLE